jgi:hypothetical protein
MAFLSVQPHAERTQHQPVTPTCTSDVGARQNFKASAKQLSRLRCARTPVATQTTGRAAVGCGSRRQRQASDSQLHGLRQCGQDAPLSLGASCNGCCRRRTGRSDGCHTLRRSRGRAANYSLAGNPSESLLVLAWVLRNGCSLSQACSSQQGQRARRGTRRRRMCVHVGELATRGGSGRVCMHGELAIGGTWTHQVS